MVSSGFEPGGARLKLQTKPLESGCLPQTNNLLKFYRIRSKTNLFRSIVDLSPMPTTAFAQNRTGTFCQKCSIHILIFDTGERERLNGRKVFITGLEKFIRLSNFYSVHVQEFITWARNKKESGWGNRIEWERERCGKIDRRCALEWVQRKE